VNDTHPDIEREFHALLMARSGEERLKMGADMFSSSAALMRAGITASFGELTEIQMREKLLERLYGDEVSAAVRREIAARYHPIND